MMNVGINLNEMKTRQESLPLLHDFCPLYSTVRPEDMIACIQAMRQGGSRQEQIKDADSAWIELVANTALETEAVSEVFICLEPEEQIAYPLAGLSDFTLATLSGIMMESMDTDHVDAMTLAMNDMLLTALDSETASPMLDYEWIFQDMVQYHVVDRRGIDPIWTLKRSAAHDWKLVGGKRIPRILAHMAGVCMELDDVTEGFRLYVSLLKYDPVHLDTVHATAMDLAYARCFKAAVSVGEHLLSLWSLNPKRYPPCPEMAAEIRMWKELAAQNKEDWRPPAVIAPLQDALFTSAPGHLDRERLLREAIPEVDEIPVKRPLM